VNQPALRVTPAGVAVLSLVVDCGTRAGALLIPVVTTGEPARAIALRLKSGVEVQIQGSLRPLQSRSRTGTTSLGVEVVANDITIAHGTLSGNRSNSIRKSNNG
jgi:primosomal replication protein N